MSTSSRSRNCWFPSPACTSPALKTPVERRIVSCSASSIGVSAPGGALEGPASVFVRTARPNPSRWSWRSRWDWCDWWRAIISSTRFGVGLALPVTNFKTFSCASINYCWKCGKQEATHSPHLPPHLTPLPIENVFYFFLCTKRLTRTNKQITIYKKHKY